MRNRRFSISLVVIITIVIGIFAGISSLPSAHAALPNPIVWATKAALPCRAAQAGVMSGLDGRIYVMGGYSHASPSTPNSTARAYDPRTDSWTTLTSMGTPTRGPGIAIDQNGLVYVISGYSGSADVTAVQVYNVTSNSWSTGTPIPTGVWMPGATTGRDGRIYVAGGEPSGAGLQVYNPQTQHVASGEKLA